MRMNRRNVLVGLGTIVAGGGAALGTGAFSSVEADRTVAVGTTGDGQAYLGIAASGNYASDGGSADAIEIDLGDTEDGEVGFNDNATTDVGTVLTLTNNSADDNEIQVSLGDGDTHSDSQTVSIEGADVTFTLSETAADGQYATLSNTEDSVDITAEIDTTVDNSGLDEDESLSVYASDGS